jgi:multidrug efflux pump subunit AcrB
VYVRPEGAFDGVEAVKNLPVNAGGKILRVGDVAEVTRGYIDPATFVIHHEGEPALILGVVMRKNFNGLTLGETLGAEEAAIQAELPVGIAFSKVSYYYNETSIFANLPGTVKRRGDP